MKKERDTRYYYFYILFALCVGILSLMMSYGMSGNDFWWHITAGEWIIDNKAIPHHDIFSWSGMEQNLSWTAHEWLSEVIYYGLFSLGGQYGVYLFCFLAGVLMLYLLYKVSGEKIFNNIAYTSLIFIFSAALIKVYFYGRPHLFSFFLLFTELKILYDYINNKNEKGIYFIPLLSVIWANIHGGSSNLTYVLCIFFIICGLFNFSFGRIEFTRLPKKKLINLSAVTIVSILALCINPYGVEMLKYPYANMSDGLMLHLITEWASPDAKDITTLVFFFIPFALGLISLLTTKKNIRGIDLLIFAFFSYMFFRSSRFIIFLIISYPFYIFDYIPSFGTLNEIKAKGDKIATGVLIGLMSAIIIFGFVNSSATYKKGKLIDHELSQEFVDLIKEDAPERPYTDYNYGGDLIYYGVEVYVDGRADVYTGIPIADYYNLSTFSIFSEYKDDYNSKTFMEDIINKYNFDAFLIDTRRPLCSYLNSQPDKYELIKEVENTAYFKVIK